MEKQNLCSVGKVIDKEICATTEFKKISTLTKEEQELLQLRCRIQVELNSDICEKHQLKFLTMFALHQKKCCDPFRKHKTTATSKIYYNLKTLFSTLLLILNIKYNIAKY